MRTKNLPPKLRRRFGEVVEFLKRKASTRAILVGGSIAQGKADRFSDIDLLVITRTKVPYVRYHDGDLDIEVESVRLQDLTATLTADPASLYAWEGFRAVYDPEHLAPRIQALRTRAVQRYRTTSQHLGDLYIRFRSFRQKARRPVKDRIADALLARVILGELVDYHYAVRNRAVPRPFKLMATALEDRRIPLAVRRMIRASTWGTLRSRTLVPHLDVALVNLAPVMRGFTKYFKPWKK